MIRHLHEIGDRVHIMDQDIDGDVSPVGWARVKALMHLDDYYLVQFESDNRIEARHIE